MTTSKKTYDYTLSVEFGGVSIGDATASVGISFPRNGQHGLEDVDEMLCGKRLDVYAIVGEKLSQRPDGLIGRVCKPS